MDANEIARVLSEHERQYGQANDRTWVFCSCDPNTEVLGTEDFLALAWTTGWMTEAEDAHRDHLASVLAPLVEQARQEGAGEALRSAGLVGRCGDWIKIGAKQACRLPAGHDGWHRSDEGSEWTHGDRAERAARMPGSGTAGGGS